MAALGRCRFQNINTFLSRLFHYKQCDKSMDSSNESDQEGCQQITRRSNRQVYMVTLSQASMALVPTRESFADALLEAYSTVNAQVVQWCVSKERHRQGGYHYHMAVKCDRPHRWLHVAKYLRETRHLRVHFSSTHINYYSAYSYVVKEDTSPLHSPNHPDLTNQQPPNTTTASLTCITNSSNSHMAHSNTQSNEQSSDEYGNPMLRPMPKRKKNSAIRAKRLQPSDIFDIVVPRQIRTKQELLVFAKAQKDEGKTDVWEFCFNRASQVVEDSIQSAWSIQNELEEARRNSLGRVGILEEFVQKECRQDCSGRWLGMAKEILELNFISVSRFARAVYNALKLGRKKNNNIYIFGPANCAKSFILKPLNEIYNTFTNPATGTYAWVGIEKVEVVFLNDFRWSPKLIPWNELLLMLEGETVSIPAPKTYFRQDLRFAADSPFFATSKYPLSHVYNGCIDHRENEMMNAQWVYFEFSAQIRSEDQVDILPCTHCFASLILEHVEEQ